MCLRYKNPFYTTSMSMQYRVYRNHNTSHYQIPITQNGVACFDNAQMYRGRGGGGSGPNFKFLKIYTSKIVISFHRLNTKDGLGYESICLHYTLKTSLLNL